MGYTLKELYSTIQKYSKPIKTSTNTHTHQITIKVLTSDHTSGTIILKALNKMATPLYIPFGNPSSPTDVRAAKMA